MRVNPPNICDSGKRVLSWLMHGHKHIHTHTNIQTDRPVLKVSYTPYTHITLTLCLCPTQNHVALYGGLLGDKLIPKLLKQRDLLLISKPKCWVRKGRVKERGDGVRIGAARMSRRHITLLVQC